ncbi:hypothetical protein A5764_09305 [Mycobacterium sp. 852002-51057_SCH5723018]|nr:hypothetical protein A5764_09305 [Mycobacterium sp. 852002-51057_SCH5723018]
MVALAQLMSEYGTNIGLCPQSLIGAARHEIASATSGFMSANLADVAAAGWKKYDALKNAARRTRDDPHAKELIALTTHKIASSHHPHVDLYVDDKRLATIEIGLEIALNITGVIAAVQQGRLTEIQSGSCTLTGSLAVQEIEMIKRQRKFDLYGAFRLGHGVPLLEPAPTNGDVEPVVIRKAEPPPTPATWHPDPTRRFECRWWDGTRWTQHVSTNGHRMSDPLVSAPDSDP